MIFYINLYVVAIVHYIFIPMSYKSITLIILEIAKYISFSIIMFEKGKYSNEFVSTGKSCWKFYLIILVVCGIICSLVSIVFLIIDGAINNSKELCKYFHFILIRFGCWALTFFTSLITYFCLTY